MADEFDEYEKLLEGKAEAAADGDAATVDPPAERREKERSSSRRGSDSRREHRDRSRSRERRRDRDRDNDFRTDRRRSRSRDRRHREELERRNRPEDRSRGDRDKYRDRDRGRGDRGRDSFRDRAVPRRRSPTPPEVRMQRDRERELAELERATRTVFAFNINIKADERDIFGFFSKAGQVTDIRLITDRHTKRSKGLAYVEFSKQEEVFAALTLTGQLLLNQPVMVKPAEAEKNLAWEAAQAAKQAAPVDADLAVLGLGDLGLPMPTAAAAVPAGPLRLQVSGFKQGLGENEIRQIFEPFGSIDSISVVRDASGQALSLAYVVFRNAVDGRNAMTHWHGQSLLDHVLNVTATAMDTPADNGGSVAALVGELDDEEGGLKINAQRRADLMNRLASSAGIMQPAAAPAAAAPFAAPGIGLTAGILPGGLLGPGGVLAGMVPGVAAVAGLGAGLIPGGGGDLSLQQGLLGVASPIPTQCLLLKNMFDASTQSEAEWEKEVAEDVREECSKFGDVLHLHVDKNSQGFVYLKFVSPAAAQAAKQVLHGRFYNGHKIEAEFQFVQIYNQFFGLQ